MDDILRELRKVREDYAKQFGYDLQAIHRDLKAQEQTSGRRVVSLTPRRPKRSMTNGTGSRAANVPGRTANLGRMAVPVLNLIDRQVAVRCLHSRGCAVELPADLIHHAGKPEEVAG